MLVEVNCETDFVAKGDIFRAMAQDVAMQIAANADVEFVAKEDASEEWVEREKASELQKEDLQSKPENIRFDLAKHPQQPSHHSDELLCPDWLSRLQVADELQRIATRCCADLAGVGKPHPPPPLPGFYATT